MKEKKISCIVYEERIKEDIYYFDIIRDFVSVGRNKIIVKDEEKSR